MSEERFTINTLDGSIDLRDNGKVMSFKEARDTLNELHNECEKYKRLFKEFAYYFDDKTTSLNDLDHKDFEALKGISNGEYFDEENLCWVKYEVEK